MCFKEFCFPDCWKISSMVPVFKNVGERFVAKNYCLVSLFSVVSKVFEKHKKLLDYLEKCNLFSDFQCGFRPSWSPADVLTVVSDRVDRAFNRFGTTWAVALDISKAFDRVWHAGLLHKHKSLVLFCLFSIIDGFEWFWLGSFHKNIQLILEFLKAPFWVQHFLYYTLTTFLMMLSVILLSVLITLLSIVSVISHLIYKTLWTGARGGLLISMLGKLNWFHLSGLITLVLLMWKWMGQFLRKNHHWRCWGWLSF